MDDKSNLLANRQNLNKEINKTFDGNKKIYETDIGFVENKVSNSLQLYETLKDIFTKTTNLKFLPQEKINENFNKDVQIDTPYVSYKVINRVVPDNKGKKPMAYKEDAKGITYNQFFEYRIQFDIFANDFEKAEKTLQILEDTLLKYQSIFVQEGISRLLFEEQLEDKSLDKFRDDASIRSVVYSVLLQRSTVQLIQSINKIDNNMLDKY